MDCVLIFSDYFGFGWLKDFKIGDSLFKFYDLNWNFKSLFIGDRKDMI